jgi:signal transduction histidine kinase
MTSRSRAEPAGSGQTGIDRTVAAGALCRAVLLGRAVVTITAAAAGLLIVARPDRVVAVIVLVALASTAEVMILTRWPGVVRHPGPVVVVDTALLAAVLVLHTGSAAFFLYAAGAAALAGVLLGTRAWPIWAVHATAGFLAAARILRADGVTPEVSAFVVAFPMATVVTGLIAAWVTASTVRHVDLLVEVIGAAQRAAASSERARLARELHDSVAKTLRGVSFAALALPGSLRGGPGLAEQLAAVVAAGADTASREARELIEGLRLDDPAEPFDRAVDRICQEWSVIARCGARVVADRAEPSPAVRYELSRILHEALRNVQRHADAALVTVRLTAAGGAVRMVVRDDGAGFRLPADPAALRSGGHFGLLGMAERARAAGGELTVRSAPGDGTTVEVLVPAHRALAR